MLVHVVTLPGELAPRLTAPGERPHAKLAESPRLTGPCVLLDPERERDEQRATPHEVVVTPCGLAPPLTRTRPARHRARLVPPSHRPCTGRSTRTVRAS